MTPTTETADAAAHEAAYQAVSRACLLARRIRPDKEVDPDIRARCGMAGDEACILMAARLLDDPDRISEFVRPADLEEALRAIT